MQPITASDMPPRATLSTRAERRRAQRELNRLNAKLASIDAKLARARAERPEASTAVEGANEPQEPSTAIEDANMPAPEIRIPTPARTPKRERPASQGGGRYSKSAPAARRVQRRSANKAAAQARKHNRG